MPLQESAHSKFICAARPGSLRFRGLGFRVTPGLLCSSLLSLFLFLEKGYNTLPKKE